MNVFITSDWHLTENFIDEYRWEVFSWIKDIILRHKVHKIIHLGDVCEQKDRHSSQLVNRLTKEFDELSQICPIVICKGNHDFIDKNTPFFGFYNMLKPRLSYIIKPFSDGDALFLPYTDSPDFDWKDLDFRGYKKIFMHQSVIGSIANNGVEMKEGLPKNHKLFQEFKGKIYSGHIHKAQLLQVGNYCLLEYVGSPYPVYFGDVGMWGGVLLTEDGGANSVLHNTLNRWMVDINSVVDLKNYKMYPGDQCKIRLKLQRSDYHLWEKYRDEIKEQVEKLGVWLVSIELIPDKMESVVFYQGEEDKKVSGFTDIELIKQFSDREKLSSEFIEIAKELIGGVI